MAIQFSQDLCTLGDSCDIIMALSEQWKDFDDVLKLTCQELLQCHQTETTREMKANKVDESNINVVKRELFQALVAATDESRSRREERYENDRLKGVDDKLDADERLLRQVQEAKTKVAQLEKQLGRSGELGSVSSLISSVARGSSALPDAGRALEEQLESEEIAKKNHLESLMKSDANLQNELRKQKEVLAWAKFQDVLAGSSPPYDLAAKRKNHDIFQTSDPIFLIETVSKMVDRGVFSSKVKHCQTQEDRQLLKSYVLRANKEMICDEIKSLITNMIGEPVWLTSDPTSWKVTGRTLVLSEIQMRFSLLKSKESACEEIHVHADDVLFIDQDWNVPGVSLALSSSNRIQVPGLGVVTINTSGKDAISLTSQKAKDGGGPGMSGDHGAHGDSGQSAGHVTICCETFVGKLLIKASGGRGADGQSGGDGKPGNDGRNGKNGELPSKMESYTSYSTTLGSFVPGWGQYELVRDIHSKVKYGHFRGRIRSYFSDGEKGVKGSDGGSGGNAGRGGEGGLKGQVTIRCKVIGEIDDKTYVTDGQNGEDGRPGSGATGGNGGQHGQDVAQAFEPDDLNPWFSVTGSWKRDREIGLELCEVKRRSDGWVMGYSIKRNSSSSKVASRGNRGSDGQQAEQISARKKSNAVKNSVASQALATASKMFAPFEAGANSRKEANRMAEEISKQKASLQHEMSRMNTKHETRASALRQGIAAARQLQSSAQRNQQDSERALKDQKDAETKQAALSSASMRIREAFKKAESIITASRSHRAVERMNRIADQQASVTQYDNDEDDTEERQLAFLSWCTDGLSQSKKAKNIECDSGVQLLDAYLDEFATLGASEETIQTLSMLVQTLFLQVRTRGNEGGRTVPTNIVWSSITDIVKHILPPLDNIQKVTEKEKKIEQPAKLLIECLVQINRNVDLVADIYQARGGCEMILSTLQMAVKEKVQLMKDSQTAKPLLLNSEIFKKTDPTSVLFSFRILPWCHQELYAVSTKVLANLKDDARHHKGDTPRMELFSKRIEDFIDECCLDAMSKDIHNCLSDTNPKPDPDLVISSASEIRQLLKELREICPFDDENKKNRRPFFEKLADKIGRTDTRREFPAALEKLTGKIRDFSREKLAIDKALKKTEAIQKWVQNLRDKDRLKVLEFVIKRNQLNAYELDLVTSAIREMKSSAKDLEEFCRGALELIERAFIEHRLKEAVDILMKHFESYTLPPNVTPLRNSFNKLAIAMRWKYNRYSFNDRLEVCSKISTHLKEIVESASKNKSSQLEKTFNRLSELMTSTEEKMCGAAWPAGNVTGNCIEVLHEMLITQDAIDQKKIVKGKVIKGKEKEGKFNVDLYKFKIKRMLFEVDQLIFERAKDLKLFSQVLHDPRIGAVSDESFRLDWEDLRNEFHSRWPSFYFLNWYKPFDDIATIKKQIRHVWETSYIDPMAHKIAERSKTLRRMDILLAKYACQTSWFLSPGQSLEKWRSLAKTVQLEPVRFEEVLVEQIRSDFAMMKLILGHVAVQARRFQKDVIKAASAAGLDVRGQIVKVNLITALARAKARKDPATRHDSWFCSVMDVLLFALRSAPSLDESIGLRLGLLAENVEIVAECGLVGWTGGASSGQPKDQPVILDRGKVNAYRSAFAECAALSANCGRVRDRLFGILDVVDAVLISSEDIVTRLNERTNENNAIFKREIESLGCFVSNLTVALTKSKVAISPEDVVRATAAVLDNEHKINALGIYRDKHWSVLQRIDVWTGTFQNYAKAIRKPKDACAWIKQLLEQCKAFDAQNDALLSLHLLVATELLCENFESFQDEDLAFFEECAKLLQNIVPANKEQNVNVSVKCLEGFQSELICKFIIFFSCLIKRRETKSCKESGFCNLSEEEAARFSLRQKLEKITNIAAFLASSTTEANQFILRFLSLLAQDFHLIANEPDSTLVIRFINEIQSTSSDKRIKKLGILNVVYPLNTSGGIISTSLVERAVIERWICREECDKNDITKLYNCIQALKKSKSNELKTGGNRLWSGLNFDLLTREEKKYLHLTGKEKAENVLKDIVPSLYLNTLRNVASSQIVRTIYYRFFGDLKEDFIENLESNKHETYKGDVSLDEIQLKKAVLFKRAFDRSRFFAKRDDREFEWLVWMSATILPSLETAQASVTIETITELLFASAECGNELLFKLTVTSRPHQWIENLVVNQMNTNVASRFPGDTDQRIFNRMATDMKALLNAEHGKGKMLIQLLAAKLDHESQLVTSFAKPIHVRAISEWIGALKTIKCLGEAELAQFDESPVRRWLKVIRHIRLTEEWSSASIATQLVNVMDRHLGPETTDNFLRVFRKKYSDEKFNKSGELHALLNTILRNLARYPWMVQKAADLAGDLGTSDDWLALRNEEVIQKRMKESSKDELLSSSLIDIMKVDADCKSAVGDFAQQTWLLRNVASVREWSKSISKWSMGNIKEWVTHFKARATIKDQPPFNTIGFLAVASIAIFSEKNYYPRDAQLLAVLIFTTAGGSVKKMAQISTGEGKTLITALLAIYHALANWDKQRHVSIITSSSVLAEANINEIKWLFDVFDVSVTNNCDTKCAENDDERRLRYNSDVIYGDLSSFQRDELLSQFYGKDITKNRVAGALIIDEVDSMLLDKGENVLYLSHNIPEMDDLLTVFVDIWFALHESNNDTHRNEEAVFDRIKRYVEERIERGETTVPFAMRPFVERHLLAWIKSAYRAKNRLSVKDSYKVDDIGDGRGKQIVVMDKETGVEQINMQWTHGLHQFLQLKHSLRVSPVSLKAVFMSNIGFFRKHTGALYGLTGTLGSAAECELMRDVFDFEIFRMPRFKRRFCWEEAPLVSKDCHSWLTDVFRSVKAQLEKKRAVLIICENIASAEEINSKLQRGLSEHLAAKISLYTSSQDEDFQKRQHDKYLTPGDVIVATNLAGRGTDFKIGNDLATNGGLHVIITYVPPNARVEDQAQGRTARAGQLGSFQFVVRHRSVRSGEDPSDELDRLKLRRDITESRRLEEIRTKGLQKIYLEETLFDRFRSEVYEPAKQTLTPHSKQEASERLKLDFLTNKWAFWLDENARLIEKAHSKDAKEVEKIFDHFKDDCISKCNRIKEKRSNNDNKNILSKAVDLFCSQPMDNNEVILFATMPSEFSRIGQAYEEASKPDAAIICYESILKNHPENEVALLHLAQIKIRKADWSQKKAVKPLLTGALESINKKVNLYSTANEMVRKTSGSDAAATNKFSEQITDKLSLLQVHISALQNVLGKPLNRSLTLSFPNETDLRELDETLTKVLQKEGLLKPHRISRKVSFSSDLREVIVTSKKSGVDAKQVKQTVEWPSALLHCKEACIALLREKKRIIQKSDLTGIVDDRQSLWEVLIAEKHVAHEKVQEGWFLKPLKEETWKSTLENLNFQDLANIIPEAVLIDWLERHYGEDFEKAAFALSLNDDTLEELKKSLKKKEILARIDRRFGFLIKKLPESSEPFSLPDSLKRFYGILSAWQDRAGENGWISREELPLPCSKEEALDTLWQFLILNRVVKEPKIICSGYSSREEIQEFTEKLTKTIKSSENMRRIFEKNCEKPDPVDDISTGDLLEYIKNNPLKYKGVLLAPGVLLSQFGFFSNIKSISREIVQEYGSEIREWLTRKERENQFEYYVQRVVSSATSSIGQLKTIVTANAKFNSLQEFFLSDHERTYPVVEIESFRSKSAHRVLAFEAAWVLDWRAIAVAALGVAQIVAGVLITTCTWGGAGAIGAGLIQEGISDLIFGIQSTYSGSFSWSAYGNHKMWSVGFTAITCGIGAYFSSGAAAAQMATYAYNGKAGLSLLIAVGKNVAVHCGRALSSVAASMAVDRFLSWLKEFAFDAILKHLKRAVSYCLSALLDKFEEWLDKLGELLRKEGLSVSEVKRRIQNLLSGAKQSPVQLAWVAQVASKASSMIGAFGSGFSQAGGMWGVEEKIYKHNAKIHTMNGDVQSATASTDQARGAHNVMAKLNKLATWAKRLVKMIKAADTFSTLVNQSPIYVKNATKTIEQEVRRLNIESQRKSTANQQHNDVAQVVVLSSCNFSEDDQSDYDSDESFYDGDETIRTEGKSSSVSKIGQQGESTEWQQFTQQVIEDLKGDVVKCMIDKVTNVWVQPFLQSKIDSAIRSLAEKAVDRITSCFSKKDAEQNAANENTKEQNKDSGTETSQSDKEKQFKRNVGEKALQKEKDANGNDVSRPQDYTEYVENLGNGDEAGVLAMLAMADFLGKSLDITGDEARDCFTICPDGKAKSDCKSIKLYRQKNPDGSQHIILQGPDGKSVQVPFDPSAPPNRCFYEAIAAYKNCSVDDLLKDFKQHAAHNERVKYFYESGFAQAFPEHRFGRDPGSERANIFVETETDDQGKVRIKRVMASLTSGNLGGGSPANNSHRELWKPLQDGTTTHLGHLIMRALGGSGAIRDSNIVLMEQAINQGVFKVMENRLLDFLQKNPGVTVHLNVILNEGVPNGNFHHPANFRFIWCTDDRSTFFVSPLIENTKEYADRYRDAVRDNNVHFSELSIQTSSGERTVTSVHLGEPPDDIVEQFKQLKVINVENIDNDVQSSATLVAPGLPIPEVVPARNLQTFDRNSRQPCVRLNEQIPQVVTTTAYVIPPSPPAMDAPSTHAEAPIAEEQPPFVNIDPSPLSLTSDTNITQAQQNPLPTPETSFFNETDHEMKRIKR